MPSIYIARLYADETVTMENNIVTALADKGDLLSKIMSEIFEGDAMTAIHPEQEKTGYGELVWRIEFNGKWGWFRPCNKMPPTKKKLNLLVVNSPFIKFKPYPPKPHKSSLSFITRLFGFR